MQPILRGFDPDSVLAWRGRGRLTAAMAIAAARQLAARLPAVAYVINLCEALDCFLVATIAALIAGRTLVLPASRLPRALADARIRYADSVCVGDTSRDGSGALDVQSFIARAAPESPVVDAWPAVAGDHPAAILFTSGSTGAAQPHSKTWGELAAGAAAFLQSIGKPPAGAVIVGTVPPQHMFGFESTVMLPLQSGSAVIAARPVFAADLADAVADARAIAPAGVWLMTTPLQLRAFHLAEGRLTGIAKIVASTMPLDSALAISVERDWHACVMEIYGCTEGGILAVRRTSSTNAWTPAAGLAFAISADGPAKVSGGHLRGSLELPDQLRAVDDQGSFELVGRVGDMVKIAGKRASLAGLTRELLDVSGVQDGVMFLPRANARRVAALAVAPGVTLAQVRRELARRIDSAFLPRPFVLTQSLPRDAAGKLSIEALRAQLASPAVGSNPDDAPRRQTLTTRISYSRDHPSLPGHFPGRPVVPGALLLTAVETVLRRAGLRIVECMQAKFMAPVLAEQALTIRVDVDDRAAARFEIASSQQMVASGTLRCVEQNHLP